MLIRKQFLFAATSFLVAYSCFPAGATEKSGMPAPRDYCLYKVEYESRDITQRPVPLELEMPYKDGFIRLKARSQTLSLHFKRKGDEAYVRSNDVDLAQEYAHWPEKIFLAKNNWLWIENPIEIDYMVPLLLDGSEPRLGVPVPIPELYEEPCASTLLPFPTCFRGDSSFSQVLNAGFSYGHRPTPFNSEAPMAYKVQDGIATPIVATGEHALRFLQDIPQFNIALFLNPEGALFYHDTVTMRPLMPPASRRVITLKNSGRVFIVHLRESDILPIGRASLALYEIKKEQGVIKAEEYLPSIPAGISIADFPGTGEMVFYDGDTIYFNRGGSLVPVLKATGDHYFRSRIEIRTYEDGSMEVPLFHTKTRNQMWVGLSTGHPPRKCDKNLPIKEYFQVL